MYKISQKLIPPKMDEKQRIKISESIQSHRGPDSIIAYMLALQKKESLPTDDKIIHSAIYNLQKEYPEFFKEFIFSRGDLYPFSKELEAIFFRFQQSGILGTMNPSFEKFILQKNTKKIILDYFSKKFSATEKKELDEIAKKFESLLTS